MGSLRGRFYHFLRNALTQHRSQLALQRGSIVCLSTTTFDELQKNEIEDDDFLHDQKELQPQGIDPRKGWDFRGVHKAIIFGTIGQVPVQKMLRNGKIVTIFTVGTGGMFDQRTINDKHLPRPAQWHRITVHNELLGTYAVQQLRKNLLFMLVYAALLFLLRGTLKLGSIMTASLDKLEMYQRFVFVVMARFVS